MYLLGLVTILTSAGCVIRARGGIDDPYYRGYGYDHRYYDRDYDYWHRDHYYHDYRY